MPLMIMFASRNTDGGGLEKGHVSYSAGLSNRHFFPHPPQNLESNSITCHHLYNSIRKLTFILIAADENLTQASFQYQSWYVYKPQTAPLYKLNTSENHPTVQETCLIS